MSAYNVSDGFHVDASSIQSSCLEMRHHTNLLFDGMLQFELCWTVGEGKRSFKVLTMRSPTEVKTGFEYVLT